MVILVWLVLSSLDAGAITPAEHFKCLDGVEEAGLACHESAVSAADQADQVSTRHSRGANGNSLNQSADDEIAATKTITQLLQAARQSCQAQAQKCKDVCKGEYAEVGRACATDIGQYVEQLSEGKNENAAGNAGSTLSDQSSSSSSGFPTADRSQSRSPGPRYTPSVADGNATSAPRANLTAVAASYNILQRPIGPASNEKRDTSSSKLRAESLEASGGENEDKTDALSRTIAKSQGPRMAQMRKVMFGSQLNAAVLSYCKSTGTTDADCSEVISANFCSAPGRQQCPSCQRKSPDEFSSAEVANVCVKSCAEDPQFGPLLADKCRQFFGASVDVKIDDYTNRDGARAPASQNQEVSGVYAESVFLIVSRAIAKRCVNGKLRGRQPK